MAENKRKEQAKIEYQQPGVSQPPVLGAEGNCKNGKKNIGGSCVGGSKNTPALQEPDIETP